MNDTVESADTDNTGTALTTAEYSATATAMTQLRHELANLVFDVKTTKGLAAAKEARAKVRTLRVDLNKLRLELNADDKKRIETRNAEAKELTAQLEALEEPIDQQIKAREAEQEAARIERERVKAAELRAINDALAAITGLPVEHLGSDSATLQAVIAELTGRDLAATFDDVHEPDAQVAREDALAKLGTLLTARLASEEQQRQIEAQRAELDRMQAEQQQQADERARAEQQAEQQRQAEREQQEAAQRAERALDAHVSDLRAIPTRLVGKPVDAIAAAIAEVEAVDPSRFESRADQMAEARVAVLERLAEMLAAQTDADRRQAEQDERQRQLDAQAEQQRQEQAAAEQRQREADEARQAEERRVAAEREEAERVERERAEAEAAERTRQQEAEAIRLATIVEAGAEAVAVLTDLGYGDHITTRKLAAAVAREQGAQA